MNTSPPLLAHPITNGTVALFERRDGRAYFVARAKASGMGGVFANVGKRRVRRSTGHTSDGKYFVVVWHDAIHNPLVAGSPATETL